MDPDQLFADHPLALSVTRFDLELGDPTELDAEVAAWLREAAERAG